LPGLCGGGEQEGGEQGCSRFPGQGSTPGRISCYEANAFD
jgi:hypothetical protein